MLTFVGKKLAPVPIDVAPESIASNLLSAFVRTHANHFGIRIEGVFAVMSFKEPSLFDW